MSPRPLSDEETAPNDGGSTPSDYRMWETKRLLAPLPPLPLEGDGTCFGIVQSTQDEFAFIQFIPETPPPNDSDGLDTVLQNRLGDKGTSTRDSGMTWKICRGPKRKRMESIRSVEGEAPGASRSTSACLDVEEVEAIHKSSPEESPNTPELSITRLKPVPRGAPRIIEKKGKYTIRKGVRIRDYKIPGPDPWPDPPSPNSPEFQCRDGFSPNEASLGYP
ncbi:hypothetical protein ACJZ2D_010937 [Fusarium nematophilum]